MPVQGPIFWPSRRHFLNAIAPQPPQSLTFPGSAGLERKTKLNAPETTPPTFRPSRTLPLLCCRKVLTLFKQFWSTVFLLF